MIWGHSIGKRRGAVLPMHRRRSRRVVIRPVRCGYRGIQTGKWFIRKYQRGTGCGNRQVLNKRMEEKRMMDELRETVEMHRVDFGEVLAHLKEGGKAARDG